MSPTPQTCNIVIYPWLVQPRINGAGTADIGDTGEGGRTGAGTAFLGLCDYESLPEERIILKTATEYKKS